MARQTGFFDVEDRLRELSAKGDALERLSTVVDFELFLLISSTPLCARIDRAGPAAV